MGTEYHRPTHTFEDEGQAYNATQVRLYGIDPQSVANSKGRTARYSAGDMKIIFEDKSEASKKGSKDVLIPIVSFITLKTKMMGGIVLATFVDDKKEHKTISMGVIYGYAFEGHCYDFPKPKIMLIRALPEEIPADDCGFEAKDGYRVWVVDRLDHCTEIELNQGFVEQIVLEANLPGKRSPRSYSATMQLAHRSGRLTE
jgi:hypothetical protein